MRYLIANKLNYLLKEKYTNYNIIESNSEKTALNIYRADLTNFINKNIGIGNSPNFNPEVMAIDNGNTVIILNEKVDMSQLVRLSPKLKL